MHVSWYLVWDLGLKRSQAPLLSALILLVGLTACSKPVRTERVKGAENATAAQEPTAKPRLGILDEPAADLLAASESEPAFSGLLTQIENHRAPNFSWARFWKRLEAHPFPTFSFPTIQRFLRLHHLDCGSEALGAFSFYRIVKGIDPALEKNTLQCALSTLGGPYTRDLIAHVAEEKIKIKDSAQAAAFVNVLFRLFQVDPTQDWGVHLSNLTERKTAQITDLLIEAKRGSEILQLAQLIRSVRSGSSTVFDKRLSWMLVTQPERLAEFRSNFGFETTLQVLNLAPNSTFAQTAPTVLKTFLESLIRQFEEFAVTTATSNRDEAWGELWEKYELIEAILRKMPRSLAEDVLMAHERALRKLDLEFSVLPEASIGFVRSLDQDSLARLWLERRLLDRLGGEGTALNLEPRTAIIDQVLRQRLAVTFETDPVTRREQIRSFCQLLTTLGIQGRSYSEVEFKANLNSLPLGCHLVTSSNKRIEIEADSLVMPIYSAVLANGVTLSLRASRVDLSIFDLSATEKPKPLVDSADVGTTIRPNDSLVLPLVVCVELLEAQTDLGLDRGLHCFPVHYPYQAAARGDSDQRELSPGLDGGSLEITSRLQALTPTLVSLGGPGQEDLRSHGRASSSKLSIVHVKNWIRQVNVAQRLNAKPDYKFLSAPTAEVMNQLFKVAKKRKDVEGRETNDVVLTINMDYLDPRWSTVDSSELKKFEVLCQDVEASERRLELCVERKLQERLLRFLVVQVDQARAQGQDSLNFVGESYEEGAYPASNERRRRGSEGNPGKLRFRSGQR